MDNIERPADPTEAPASVGGAPTVQVILRYEDGSPMADAEWEAAFGDRSLSGRADDQGSATIAVPAGHTGSFRLFLRSFPERYVDREGQP
jgi:hypothetical protein